eukprot:1084267-Amphidinium_carterae.1
MHACSNKAHVINVSCFWHKLRSSLAELANAVMALHHQEAAVIGCEKWQGVLSTTSWVLARSRMGWTRQLGIVHNASTMRSQRPLFSLARVKRMCGRSDGRALSALDARGFAKITALFEGMEVSSSSAGRATEDGATCSKNNSSMHASSPMSRNHQMLPPFFWSHAPRARVRVGTLLMCTLGILCVRVRAGVCSLPNRRGIVVWLATQREPESVDKTDETTMMISDSPQKIPRDQK